MHMLVPPHTDRNTYTHVHIPRDTHWYIQTQKHICTHTKHILVESVHLDFVYLGFYHKNGSVEFGFIPLCAGGKIRRQGSLSFRLKF